MGLYCSKLSTWNMWWRTSSVLTAPNPTLVRLSSPGAHMRLNIRQLTCQSKHMAGRCSDPSKGRS
jgi:hypothetical protein